MMIQILPGNHLLIDIHVSGLDRYRECTSTLNIWAYISVFCEFRLKFCHLILWRQHLNNIEWIFCTQNPWTAMLPLPVYIFNIFLLPSSFIPKEVGQKLCGVMLQYWILKFKSTFNILFQKKIRFFPLI